MKDGSSRGARVLLLSATISTAAAAQPAAPLQLDWQAPSGCPQADWLRERIRGLVSSRTLLESRLRVRGTIAQREDGRYRLELVMQEDSLVGQRELSSDSCEDLAGAAAVAVGLLLRGEETALGDPLLGPGAGDPTGSETSSGTNAPEPPVIEPPRPEEPATPSPPPAPTPRGWRALVKAPSVVVEAGALPRTSLGLAAGLGIRTGGFSVSATGTWWREQTIYGVAFPEHGAKLARKTVGLHLAYGVGVGPFELGPSATVGLEHVKARGVGPGVAATDDNALWLSAGGGGFAALRLSPSFALSVELGARVQTARPPISIEGLGPVRRWGAAAFSGAVGAEWSF